MERKRIVVAMSGGVDSTTVAALLKKEGHDVIGITMQLLDYSEAEGGCCSLDHVVDARRSAEQMGIPHYVVNFQEEFRKHVLDDYLEKYKSGKTPIPCVLCNQHVKFDLLLKRAMELGADYLATGHYARIERENGVLSLKKAVDEPKDQTYFLYTLTEKELSKLLFPLGALTKEEVRELAKDMNLRQAEKKDSTGVCFAPTGNYRDFLVSRSEFREEEGEIVSTGGEVLGKHNGIFSYTVGQRRGLGIATGRPMYVTGIDPAANRVIVGGEEDIYGSRLIAEEITWINNRSDMRKISDKYQVKAKVRSRHRESDAYLSIDKESGAVVEFKKPQRSLTPGQAVVFYKNDTVLGGGWIKEVLHS